MHKEPKSFINYLDRVYSDLLPQYKAQPSELDKVKALLKQAENERKGPKLPPQQSMTAIENTQAQNGFGASNIMGNACQEYRKIADCQNLCYEYTIPKPVGTSPEECVALAVALDIENGETMPPLLMDDIVEIGVIV